MRKFSIAKEMTSLVPDMLVDEVECVRLIRDTFAEETAPVRKEYMLYGKSQYYTRMKCKLPRAFFTAEMHNLSGTQTHVRKSDLFAIDIDLDGNEELFEKYSLSEIKVFILENFNCASIIHVSVSGKGLRVVHRINPVLDVGTEWMETDAYNAMSYMTRSAWLYYAKYYAQMSIKIDTNCADAYRCGFLCHDPDVVYVPDAVSRRIIVQPFSDITEMKVLTKADRVKTNTITSFTTSIKPAAEVRKFMQYALSRAKFVHEMSDQTEIYAYIVSFGRTEGYDVQQVRACLEEYGFDANAQFALAERKTRDSGYVWEDGHKHEYLVHLIAHCCVVGITEEEFREAASGYIIDRVADKNVEKLFRNFNRN